MTGGRHVSGATPAADLGCVWWIGFAYGTATSLRGLTPSHQMNNSRRVRNLFTDYGQKNLLSKATPEDRRAFIQKLAQELGPDEFRALLREVFGAEVPARAERP
ncbi:MAG: hypothetical protein IPM33_05295 [Phycisphaerales bacterium]|nr:hypothetical protein [Phycisphaerales bacterium]